MRIFNVLSLIGILVFVTFCKEPSSTLSKEKNQGKLSLVQAEYVCMPQDAIYHRKMIPVEVKGKTYYGCCQGCVEQIKKEPDKSCFAIDPITGEKIDKSEAIILNLWGKARYFASKKNARQYATSRGYGTDF